MSKWVLVVEDDEDNRSLVLTILEDAGYRALGAENGTEALRAMELDLPCLVLADLMMPDMDGRELVLRTRESCDEPPPFVFITGAHPSKTEDISSEILPKPFDFEQLLRIVARHCGQEAVMAPSAV